MKYAHSYLMTIQFLGFRFHGWQKQTNAKTVHEMIDKTLDFVFDDTQVYKTLGAGRTDAKVSASKYALQLFVKSSINEADFIADFNYNAPPDIRMLSVVKTSASFNIIQSSKYKEYHYYFSFGEKTHPFAAPFIVGLPEPLDVDLMMQGASLFSGVHFFHKYCTKPSEKTVFKREIDLCEIVENTVLQANFFPEKSYVLKVKGKGFLRYQIRLMMGVLFELGRGKVDLDFIKASLAEDNDRLHLPSIAPSSGLQLYDLDFED
ncbi:tRNA pseudouridine synthase A [Polaribacter pacificus]|uniref:tRNA pseudouridine synthase A n=1 Tax=Polaribacter pacificus TaxID=1775173 RepID=A0A917I0K6_9FLAO|nr:tRNA pseudouridine(38-40) synthase TruA [Polaribacter pacificus]GGH01847.1 tRNA pseudouridine synthase A [Polaribacter pacificus]